MKFGSSSYFMNWEEQKNKTFKKSYKKNIDEIEITSILKL
jgi:heme oxygenase